MTTTPPTSSPRTRPTNAERGERVRNALIESRLTPNAISLTGFVLCVIAAVFVWQEELFIGGLFFIVGSICDMLDGKYSRMSGKASPFGAFLDSTLDRIEESVVLVAIATAYAVKADSAVVAVIGVAMVSSIMVSYTRARAEALGVECKVGFGNRAGRVIILSAGLLLADLGVLVPALCVLAVLSTVTVLQRIFHVRKQLIAAPPVA